MIKFQQYYTASSQIIKAAQQDDAGQPFRRPQCAGRQQRAHGDGQQYDRGNGNRPDQPACKAGREVEHEHGDGGKAGADMRDAVVRVTAAYRHDPGDGLAMITADIAVDLPHVSKQLGTELVENAERACPYAKMARQGTRCTVPVVWRRKHEQSSAIPFSLAHEQPGRP